MNENIRCKKLSEAREKKKFRNTFFAFITLVFNFGLVVSYRCVQKPNFLSNWSKNFNMNILSPVCVCVCFGFKRLQMRWPENAPKVPKMYAKRNETNSKQNKTKRAQTRTTITNKIFYYGNVPIVDMYLPNKWGS